MGCELRSMKTSVALATFNGEKFLEEQLRSIALQTRLPDELVVGDDCSSDNTLRILHDFARVAPFPVRIFVNPENVGFERNFARTLMRCTGNIIFLCDQDDVWYPEKIAICHAEFKSDPKPQVISHDAHLADHTNAHGGLTLCAQLEASGGDRGAIVYGCCLAFDRFFVNFFHGDLAYSHDCWLVDIGHLLGACHHLDLPLISYRRHGNNATSSHHTSLSPASKFQAIRRRLQQARSAGIATEVATKLIYINDLSDTLNYNRDKIINEFGGEQLGAALADLENRAARLRTRQYMYTLPRWSRFVQMVRLRIFGEYNGVSMLGFIRDLLEKTVVMVAEPGQF